MRTTITIGAALVILIMLGGCASGQMDRRAAFTESSPTSLVMFGVDMQSEFKSPDFVFGKYDGATGRVDPSAFYHATPRLEQITGGQEVAAYLTGHDSRAVRHVYFVINLPPGEWFLWRVELDTFSGVQVKLVDDEAPIARFECAKSRLPRRECDPTQIVVSR